jgi:hypothetical protein
MYLPEYIRGRNKEDKNTLLYNRILTIYRDIAVYKAICFNPLRTTEGLASNLRNLIFMNNKESKGTISTLQSTTISDILFIERYIYNNHNYIGNCYQSSNKSQNYSKIYFICKKEGYWSTNHSKAEYKTVAEEYKKQFKDKTKNNYR